MAAETKKTKHKASKSNGHAATAAGKTKSSTLTKQTAAKPAVISKKVDKNATKDGKKPATASVDHARTELPARSSLLTTNEVDFPRGPAPPRTKAPKTLAPKAKDDADLFKVRALMMSM